MSGSGTAVSAHEFVFRRVHRNHVDAGPPLAVRFPAFRPTVSDTSGLSVFRQSLTSAAEVAASGRKPGEYYVARLAVADVKSLGLSVFADELPNGPTGHALIPELSFGNYQSDKPRSRAVQERLAEMASRNIV